MSTTRGGSLRAQIFRRLRTAVGAGLYVVGDAMGSARTRLLGLRSASEHALAQGDTEKAEGLARDLLEAAERFRDHWYYGNAVHYGHELLGRIRLTRGDLAGAERELLEAGGTPGSPQLNSFGPSFVLARDLLLEGRRDAVLRYLDLCRGFWCPDEATDPGSARSRHMMDRWAEEIREGKVPDFGPNLFY